MKQAVLAALNAANRPGERVVEKWQSGSSWCRVWSDGWIQQGGYFPVSGSVSSYGVKEHTISLVRSFSNSDYTANITLIENGYCYANVKDRTSSKINVFIRAAGNNTYPYKGLLWYACGY